MFNTIARISGVNQDITKYTKKYGQDSVSLDFTSGDSLYLGSRLKFNHAFIKHNSEVLTEANFSVSLWSGSEFIEVGRLTDETYGFTKSAVIEFAPLKSSNWQCEDTDQITDIADIQYLDLYWTKIEFNSDVTLDLDFVGHKFSNDFDLFAEMPELNNSSFFTYFNQSDFEKQAVIAADMIESKLIRNGYAKSNMQVLEWSDLTLASVSKTAQLIYVSFGNSYTDNVTALKAEYSQRVSDSYPLIDHNNTAEKSTNKKITVGTLYR